MKSQEIPEFGYLEMQFILTKNVGVFSTGCIVGKWFVDAKNLSEDAAIPCDGRTVSTEKFSELFVRIGNMFGKGDLENEFRVPDLRGRIIVTREP